MEFINRIKHNWGTLDESWRFAITAFLVARIFYAIWSWVILVLQPVAVHYIGTTAAPGVVFLDMHSSQSFAYFRTVNGETLTFRATGKNTVLDLQTGSLWEIQTGHATQGHFKGYSLSLTTSPEMFSYFLTKPYPNAYLGLWQRFDANWYTTIAEYGYGNIPGDDHYPPLFPLLIRLVTPITRNSFLAGLIISHIATLYALKLLTDLFVQWSDRVSGKKTVFYYVIYPAAYYLFSVYTESVFLVAALLSLRTMQEHKWGWAGFWTFCAISTRLQGAALIPAMLYLMWRDTPFLKKIQHWLGLGISGVALLFYLFLRSTQVETVMPFSEPVWRARLVLPWQTYFYAVQTLLSGDFNYIDFLNWFVATLFLVLLIVGWRKIPLEYNLYTVFSLLIVFIRIVDTQPLISMSRYALTLFPAFFTLSFVDKNPVGRRIVIYSSIAIGLYLSSDFFGWGWVA